MRTAFWAALAAAVVLGAGCAAPADTDTEVVIRIPGQAGTEIVSMEGFRRNQAHELNTVIEAIAARENLEPFEVTVEALMKDPAVKAMGLYTGDEATYMMEEMRLSQMLLEDPLTLPVGPNMAGFQPVNLAAANNPIASFTVATMSLDGEEKLATLSEHLKDNPLQVIEVTITEKPAADAGPEAPAPEPTTQWVGPMDSKFVEELKTELAKETMATFEFGKTYPVTLYANADNRLMLVVGGGFPHANRLSPGGMNFFYYQYPLEFIEERRRMREEDPVNARMPRRFNPFLGFEISN